MLDAKEVPQFNRLGVIQPALRLDLKSLLSERAAPMGSRALREAEGKMPAGQQSASFHPYVLPDDLTHRPFPLEHIEIFLPEDQLLSGKLSVRLYIGSDGWVERVEVVNSSLPLAYGALAEQAFVKRRFSPGRLGNKAVPTFTEVEIEFNPPE